MDILSLIAIKKMALKNFINDTVEYRIDKAYRHYSKTYATPLEEAKKLPIAEVYLIYLDDQFSELKLTVEEAAEQLNMLGSESTGSPVFGSEMAQESISDDEWIAQQEALIANQEKKIAEKMKKRKEQEAAAKVKATDELGKILGDLADVTSQLKDE